MTDEDTDDWIGNGKAAGRRVAIGVAILLTLTLVASGGVVQDNVPVSGEVTLQSNTGTNVTLTGATNLTSAEEFVDDSTIAVGGDDGGSVRFSSTGPADVTISRTNVSGRWTNVTQLDVTSNGLTINASNNSPLTVAGETDRLSLRRGISASDEEVDFVYAGTSGQTDVTVRGLSPNIRVVAVDNSGTILASDTTGSSGVADLTGMPNSEHTVTLKTESGPYVDESDPDGEFINASDRQVNLNATVVDPQGNDFDEVTLEFYNQTSGSYEVVATETNHPSGNEINASVSAFAGQNEWRVVMNASGGRDVTSDTFTFTTPGVITVWNGTSETKLTEGSSVTFRSSSSNYGASGSTTSETFDLATVSPPDEVLRSDWSSADMENGSLVIDDPGVNRTVVLYESAAASTYQQCFSVDDATGTFTAQNSWVVVEQRLDGEWTTAASERFGVDNNASVSLKDGESYRIRLVNEAGDTRVLDGFGADTAKGANCVVLSVEQALGDVEDPDTVRHNVTCQASPKQIEVAYNDSARATETIYLEIHEFRNESNVLVTNTTFTGEFGEFTYTKSVPEAQNETSWVVVVNTERDGAENVQFREPTCGNSNLLGGAPAWLITFFFTGMILVTAGLFSQLNGALGGIVVAGMGAIFWFLGLAPPGLGGGVVALSMLTAGVLFVRDRGGGL